jgi:hypothetical protein
MNKFEKVCMGAVCLSGSLCFMVFAVGLAIRLFEGC